MPSALAESILSAIFEILIYGTGYVIFHLLGVKNLEKKDSLCGLVGLLFWAVIIIVGYLVIKEFYY